MILIDTGPLVSLFDPRDLDHKACHTILGSIKEPLFTSEAVLTEALYMLEPESRGAEGLKEFILEGHVTLSSINKKMLARCFELMSIYHDLPMDFADATLVALAETNRSGNVFTLDLRDFQIYRFKKGYRSYSLNILGMDLLKQG